MCVWGVWCARTYSHAAATYVGLGGPFGSGGSTSATRAACSSMRVWVWAARSWSSSTCSSRSLCVPPVGGGGPTGVVGAHEAIPVSCSAAVHHVPPYRSLWLCRWSGSRIQTRGARRSKLGL
jgi:hypothetical protein